MQASDNFAKRAKEAFKKGKEEISTGIFKWKADYNSAVSYFEEAAKLYKSAKDYAQSIESLEKAILCNEKLNERDLISRLYLSTSFSVIRERRRANVIEWQQYYDLIRPAYHLFRPWAVARNCESQAVLIMDQELRNFDDRLIQICEKAAMFFKLADSYQNALALYFKESKYLVKIGRPDESINVMRKGLIEADDTGKQHNKADVFNYLVELLIDREQYDVVLDMYKKELMKGKNSDYKVMLEDYALIIVILCIILGEEIRAEDELSNAINVLENFHKSPEYRSASDLIDFYKEGKQEEFDKLLLKSPIKGLFPVNVVRQIKKVRVKQVIVLPSKPKTTAGAAQGAQRNAQDEDDDEIIIADNAPHGQDDEERKREDEDEEEQEAKRQMQKQLEDALL